MLFLCAALCSGIVCLWFFWLCWLCRRQSTILFYACVFFRGLSFLLPHLCVICSHRHSLEDFFLFRWSMLHVARFCCFHLVSIWTTFTLFQTSHFVRTHCKTCALEYTPHRANEAKYHAREKKPVVFSQTSANSLTNITHTPNIIRMYKMGKNNKKRKQSQNETWISVFIQRYICLTLPFSKVLNNLLI